MSWRTIATVLIIVFSIVLLQAAVAQPFVEVVTSLNDSGDYQNDHWDGNTLISDMIGPWFDMGLIAIFGMFTWAVARVLRRELTRGGGL